MSRKRKKILVVDDEIGIRELLTEILTEEGYAVVAAENAEEAWTIRMEEQLSLILLDIWMPGLDGVTLLKQWVDAEMTETPVILMSGHATIDTAVEAVKLGAREVLEKPIAMNQLLVAVQNALNSRRGAETNPIIQRAHFGKSAAMRRLKARLLEVSTDNRPVLLVGAPNSGVSFFAQFLRPPKSPMVLINEGAQLEDDIAPVLRRADGGLIVVRLINFLSPAQQSGLLGLVRESGRMGIRVAAGSSEEPEELAKKRFNENLAEIFSRQVVMLPSLSEAMEDIPDLVSLISRRLSENTDLAGRHLTTQAVNLLRQHRFENEFVELLSIVRSALMYAESDKADAESVRAVMDQFSRHMASGGVSAGVFSMPLRDAREMFEREYFNRLMQAARGNMQQAAKTAGLERTYFYRKLKQYQGE